MKGMLIIGKPKGDDEDSSAPPDVGGLEGRARKSAARDVMSAVKAGDIEALDKALAAHAEACSYAAEDASEGDIEAE